MTKAISLSFFKSLPKAATAALLVSQLALAAATFTPSTALAQASGSPFAPIMQINDMVITRYELDQRMRFLQLLRIPGDPETEALRGLTQDRLAADQAKRFGFKMNEGSLRAGMEEFAGRANLTPEQFVEALAQGGVSAETFRDFVGNGIIWREIIRGRYLASTSVSEAEIDRAITKGAVNPAVQMLISELIIPVEGDPSDEMALARRLRSEISSEAGFAAAARSHSASPSAGRGGRLDWMPAANLPPQVVQMLLSLAPGQVSQPFTMPNAVALFQLRDVTGDRSGNSPSTQVEYAEFLLPNTETSRAEAAALANRVDSCKDLYAEARSMPGSKLEVYTRQMSEVPSDVGTILASLDAGESAAALVRGNARVMVMLCSRGAILENPIDRNAIRDQLLGEKLNARAEGLLEELRSEAIIKTF